MRYWYCDIVHLYCASQVFFFFFWKWCSATSTIYRLMSTTECDCLYLHGDEPVMSHMQQSYKSDLRRRMLHVFGGIFPLNESNHNEINSCNLFSLLGETLHSCGFKVPADQTHATVFVNIFLFANYIFKNTLYFPKKRASQSGWKTSSEKGKAALKPNP